MTRRLTAAFLVAIATVMVATAARAADPKEIPITIENNRFSPEEIKVKAGEPFVLVVTNKDKAPEEFESRELRVEKVIPAGKTVRIKVAGLRKGTYPFIGDFHSKTAQGRIIAE